MIAANSFIGYISK